MLYRYGRELNDLYDLQKEAFNNRDYDLANFIEDEVLNWNYELERLEKEAERQERYADDVQYGMMQIRNLIVEFKDSIESAPKISRKEVLEWINQILGDFGEYI